MILLALLLYSFTILLKEVAPDLKSLVSFRDIVKACLVITLRFGSVVEWLKRCAHNQHGLGSKPTRAILLCPWERLLPCLVVLASSSKLKSYLY